MIHTQYQCEHSQRGGECHECKQKRLKDDAKLWMNARMSIYKEIEGLGLTHDQTRSILTIAGDIGKNGIKTCGCGGKLKFWIRCWSVTKRDRLFVCQDCKKEYNDKKWEWVTETKTLFFKTLTLHDLVKYDMLPKSILSKVEKLSNNAN